MNNCILLVFFYSFDVNGDGLVTADDLEACLPSTVESRQLVQELMRQWDKVILFALIS